MVWSCSVCTMKNDDESAFCQICGETSTNNVWKCSMCTMMNTEKYWSDRCQVCYAPRQNINVPDKEDEADDESNEQGDDYQVSFWMCPMCAYRNVQEAGFCAYCTFANPNTGVSGEQGGGNDDPLAQANGDVSENKMDHGAYMTGGTAGQGEDPNNEEKPMGSKILSDAVGDKQVTDEKMKEMVDFIIDKAPTAKLAVGVLKSLKKVTSRISDEDGHFRILDTRAKAVQSKLLGFDGVLEYLKYIGFEINEAGVSLICTNYPNKEALDKICKHMEDMIKTKRWEYQGGSKSKEKEKAKSNGKFNPLMDADKGDDNKNNHYKDEYEKSQKLVKDLRAQLDENKKIITGLEQDVKTSQLHSDSIQQQLTNKENLIQQLNKDKLQLINTVGEQMNQMREYLIKYQNIAKQLQQKH